MTSKNQTKPPTFRRIEKTGTNPTLYRVPGDPTLAAYKTPAEAQTRANTLNAEQNARDARLR